MLRTMTIYFMAVALALAATSTASAQRWKNTPLDPGTYKSLPIENTPLDPGTWRPPSGGSRDDGYHHNIYEEYYGIDENGYFYSEGYGTRTTHSKERGQLKPDAKTGRAFWEYRKGGKRYWSWAAPKWQKQLDEQLRAQRQLADTQREAERRETKRRADEILWQQAAQRQNQQQQFAQQQFAQQQFAQQQWQQAQAEAARQAELQRQMQIQFNGVQGSSYTPQVVQPAEGRRLGVTVSQVDVGAGEIGLRIETIGIGSLAERIQLDVGDILTQIDGVRVRSAEDVLNVLRNANATATFRLINVRTGQYEDYTVQIN